MSEETLLTAARRLARYLRIDLAGGGIVSEQTVQALETLDRMIAADAQGGSKAPVTADFKTRAEVFASHVNAHAKEMNLGFALISLGGDPSDNALSGRIDPIDKYRVGDALREAAYYFERNFMSALNTPGGVQ